MPRVVFAPAAEIDLEAIYDYVAARNATAADQLLAGLEDLATRLAANPGMGRPRPELLSGLRSFSVGAYLMFYRSSDSGIEVLRVLHGARDFRTQFIMFDR